MLDQAKVFSNVLEACKDLNQVWATSARIRYKFDEIVTLEEASRTIINESVSGQKIGILFGGERAGLSNEELFIS